VKNADEDEKGKSQSIQGNKKQDTFSFSRLFIQTILYMVRYAGTAVKQWGQKKI